MVIPIVLPTAVMNKWIFRGIGAPALQHDDEGNIGITLRLRKQRRRDRHIGLHNDKIGHDSPIAEKHGRIRIHTAGHYSEEIKKILAHPGCMAEQ